VLTLATACTRTLQTRSLPPASKVRLCGPACLPARCPLHAGASRLAADDDLLAQEFQTRAPVP
jgi:hypothetical protein